MTHFDKYKILNDSQHGFRKRRGCDTQLLLTTNDLANSFDKNKQVDAVLLDFSKAFDRVPHRRLLKKFHHYGITGKIHRWIETFLTKRQQCVVLDGVQSSPVDVDSSIPQGTVIGPLSFLVFINDLPNYISEGTKTRHFADDAFVYREISSQWDIATLQKDLDSLTKWGDEWQMTFNTDKCYTMHFTTKKSPVISDYILCGNQLKSTDVHPYLGIQFSDNLRWKKHILTVTNSCKKMGVIRRNFQGMFCWCQVKIIPILDLIKVNLWFCSMVSFNQRRRTSSWYDPKICSPPVFQWLLKRIKCHPDVRETGMDQFGRLQTYHPTLHDVSYYPWPCGHQLERLPDQTYQTYQKTSSYFIYANTSQISSVCKQLLPMDNPPLEQFTSWHTGHHRLPDL